MSTEIIENEEKEVKAELSQANEIIIKNDNLGRKIILSILLIAIAIGSFVCVGKFASNPQTYKSFVQTLDKKQSNMFKLSASTAAVATIVSVVGGDRGEAIANKLFDITGYFVIILSAIMLEKYLMCLFGLAAFKIIIPLACLIAIYAIIRNDSERIKTSFKLILFALSMAMLIPVSVMVSDFIDETYNIGIESKIAEAESIHSEIEVFNNKNENKEEKIEESNNKVVEEAKNIDEKQGFGSVMKNAFNNVKDVVGGGVKKVAEGVKDIPKNVASLPGNVIGGIANILNKVVDYFNTLFETLIVMLVTSFVIPAIVVIIYLWLVKIFFKLDFEMNIEKVPKLSKKIRNKKNEKTEK